LLCPPGTKTNDINNPVWSDYERYVLRARFLREDGVWLETMANAMDRAHATPQVNALWMRSNCPRFYLVRGSDSLSSRISMEKEDKGGGSKDPRTNQFRGSVYKYYDVGVSTLKAEVYSNLLRVELIQDGKIIETPNMMYFPDDYDEEYYRQLTAEEYTPSGKSNKKGSWKTTHDRNEVLDCTVYSLAMWYKLDLHRWGSREYDLLEAQLKNSAHEQQGRKITAKQNVAKLMSTGIKY
jgi:phage terminase large subunit GpA-like protein